jgi:hypothetical protein
MCLVDAHDQRIKARTRRFMRLWSIDKASVLDPRNVRQECVHAFPPVRLLDAAGLISSPH